jgi:outer membrane protein assembly factor BamB
MKIRTHRPIMKVFLGAKSVVLVALLGTLALGAQLLLAADWPQWGGENRNFKANSRGLSDSWPSAGPRQLWSRELGEGYSTVAVEGGRLYTLYRSEEEGREVVIAIDATDGKTIWEYGYPAPPLPRINLEYGPGPHATPLIVGDLVYAVGATGKFHALSKKTGKPVWSHDFYKEFGTVWRRGYSCSPIAYGNTVIVTLGRKGHAVVAFNQEDGSVVWKKQDFPYGFSSPVLINVDGQDQLVVFMGKQVAGLDAASGDLLWSHPHETSYGLNISTPVWGEGNLLFVSSAYNGGSRLLRLSQSEGRTAVEELWFNNRMRIHFGNAIRIGDYVYGSSGDFGPAFFSAIQLSTGKVVWRDRSLARTSSVYADGKFILVDEDGDLVLATATPKGLTIHSRAGVLNSNAWTAPTLVDTTRYVRDRKMLRAFQLD